MTLVDGSGNAIEEGRRMKDLIEAAEMQPGDTFYLLSARWWRHWAQYVQFEDSSAFESNLSAMEALKHGPLSSYIGKGAATFQSRPPPIDNSDLVVGPSSAETMDLCQGLVEVRDFVLLPVSAWQELKKRYGGGPEIGRQVIAQGRQEESQVEIYPLNIEVLRCSTNEKKKCTVSRQATVGDLFNWVVKEFSLEKDKTRLWDFYLAKKDKLLDNESQTLEDAQMQPSQQVLVEELVDGKWPNELPKTEPVAEPAPSAVGMELAIVAGGSDASSRASTGPMTRNRFLTDSFLSGTGGFDGEPTGPKGVVGLQNLGNTCFMNSALQCLLHTQPLVDYFLEDFTPEINKTNPLGMEGELAVAFGDLLRKVWSGSRVPIPPRAFKAKLARFAPQFSGYSQHDSQELLAFLLDGLHEDLNRVLKKPYIETKDSDGRPDEEVAEEAWANHKARNNSVIVDVCQGQFKSTLVCPKCSKTSITFDPFMYLTLPLPATKTRSLTVTVISGDGSLGVEMYTVVVSKTGRVKDVIRELAKACALRVDEKLLLCEEYQHSLYQWYEERRGEESSSAIKTDDKLVAYRVPVSASALMVVQHRRPSQGFYYSSSSSSPFACPLVTPLPPQGVASGAQVFDLVRKVLRPFERSRPETGQAVSSTSGGTLEEEAESLGPHAGANGVSPNGGSLEVEMSEVAENEAEEEVTSTSSHVDTDMRDVVTLEVPGASGRTAAVRTGSSGASGGASSQDLAGKAVRWQPFEMLCSGAKNQLGRDRIQDDDTALPESFTTSGMNTGLRFVSLEWTSSALVQQYNLSQLEALPAAETARKTRQDAVSLGSCLESFLTEEPLGPEDMWFCPQCKEHRQASKKLDLWRMPEVLVVALKRFSYSRYYKNKLDTFVDFPLRSLDLSPYLARPGAEPAVYELYAVSNHYGGMGSGHYTAYAWVRDGWCNFDDSHVSAMKEAEVKTSAAYVLFYRKQSRPRNVPKPLTARKGSQQAGAKVRGASENEQMIA